MNPGCDYLDKAFYCLYISQRKFKHMYFITRWVLHYSALVMSASCVLVHGIHISQTRFFFSPLPKPSHFQVSDFVQFSPCPDISSPRLKSYLFDVLRNERVLKVLQYYYFIRHFFVFDLTFLFFQLALKRPSRIFYFRSSWKPSR